MYLNSFNHFRAIAIVLIVAGHSYNIAGLICSSFLERTIVNITMGGTSLFVFISGFLFHHIFYKKYQYKKFVADKLRNILIPYLVLGIFPVIYYTYYKSSMFDGFFLPHGVGVLREYVVPMIKYFWTGGFLTTYWYVPFILITFMLSPFHFWFIKSHRLIQLVIIFCCCALSILMQRPVENLYVIQSVIYFTPVYLIGIMCSIHKEIIYDVLKGKEVMLFTIVIFLAALEAHTGVIGNYHKSAFDYGGLDLMFMQKIAMCLFFMVFLHRFETSSNQLIHVLASTSFSIFFLHPILILWGTKILHQYFGINQYITFNSWAIYLMFVVAITLLSIVIAKTIRMIMPKYSRLITGY